MAVAGNFLEEREVMSMHGDESMRARALQAAKRTRVAYIRVLTRAGRNRDVERLALTDAVALARHRQRRAELAAWEGRPPAPGYTLYA